MRFRSLQKWDLNPSLDGLLFFAQRLDELLFDYTLDSYKPSALNAPFLCIEALKLIRDIEEERIEKTNLSHVMSELEWSVNNDEIAKKLLDLNASYYILKDDSVPLVEKRHRLNILGKTLEPSRYLKRCKEELFDAIENSRKKEIDSFARNFTTTLINFGYSRTFLYNSTLDFFFFGNDRKINSVELLNVFFDKFCAKAHTYEVLFLVSPLIKVVIDSVKAFNIEITDNIPEHFSSLVEKYKFEKENDDQEYVLVKSVKALDHHAARLVAEKKLDNLTDLFSLFYHKNQISWNEKVIVVKKCCDKKSALVNLPKGVMEKGFDQKEGKASKELNRLISNFSMIDRESFQKFNRVADLHGVCISNNIVENQLVNLWTSIETLVPSRVNTTKINSIVSFIMPFVVINYIRRIIERLVSDLFGWNKWAYKKILRKVGSEKGDNIYQKTLSLLVLDKDDDLIKELYAELKDFHLLRYRFFSLSKVFSKPSHIKKFIENHKKKVDWQIRRIYRTRNLIVHSSARPTYIETLIENGHDYLDQMMFGIMLFSCGEYRVSTLEQAFELAKIKQIKFDRKLEDLQKSTSNDKELESSEKSKSNNLFFLLEI
ncbi:hypothetical protein [Thiothrix fructosivorans]|uniref:Apea-like HEPN domain-containing protein n=1 Tax=Thiothrix fructosivorans TaxID=111770 RepID=A0ABS3IL96_9GAMM|nr:hypothetical protein [Thiothrix fructosivorans]MBO0613792.1 hypothetical protein [Thiothrix fructosivorans]